MIQITGMTVAYAVRGEYEVDGWYTCHEVVAVALSEDAAAERARELTAYFATRPGYTDMVDVFPDDPAFDAKYDAWQAAEKAWHQGNPLGAECRDFDSFDVQPLPLLS